MTDVLLANLGRLHPERFEANLRRVHRAAGVHAVVCLLEIDEADKPEEMEQVADLFSHTHRIIGRKLFNPILVPKWRVLLRQEQTLGSEGMPKISPHRTINEVTLGGLGQGPDESVLSIHRARIPPTASAAVQRDVARLRIDSTRVLRRRAAERHKAGDAVTILGDFNAKRIPVIVPGERVLFNAAPDFGRAIAPAGHRVAMGDRVHVDLTIDGHDLEGVSDLRFPKRK